MILHVFMCLHSFVHIVVITVSDNVYVKPVVKKVSENTILQLVPLGFNGEQESLRQWSLLFACD